MRTTELETDVAHSFAVDVAEHELIVRLDQGLYRHLVFQQRENSWNNRFELITAPGSLTITGDRGAYTFRRLTDMFEFFRNNPDRPHRINISYWAEKLPDGGRSVKKYSEEATRQLIKENLDEAVQELDELRREYDHEYADALNEWMDAPDRDEWPQPEQDEEWSELVQQREMIEKAREVLAEAEYYGNLSYKETARGVLRELEQAGLVSDTYEWDLSDWDFHFVWCLHAIAWGIQQYDIAVRSGAHTPQDPQVTPDVPLPTKAPEKPERQQLEPISFEVTMAPVKPQRQQLEPANSGGMTTAEIVGDVL